MNKELIKKEDISFFDKIRRFFKGLFSKKNQEEVIPNQKKEEVNIKRNEFEESLKVDETNANNKEKDLKDFINTIESNPDLLYNLSNDRLDKLIDYYKDVTFKKRIKIEKLKAQIS